METKNKLMDTESFDWEEATESAIHQRKYLLNKLFSKEEVPKESGQPSAERFHPYARNYNNFY
jgi:hypothetical protein